MTNGEILLAEETVAPHSAVISQKSALEATSEEEEPEQDIEMPPPMEIQEHSFKPESKEISTDDVSSKLVSFTLIFKYQSDDKQSEFTDLVLLLHIYTVYCLT